METIDLKKRLAALARWEFPEGAPVVSVYLDTRWTDEQQRERVRIFLKNELRRARDAGRAPAEDLDWIAERGTALIEQSAYPDVSGVAMFACASAGLRELIPVRVAFENRFVVNDRPYLPPLAAAVEETPTALVVFIDGTSARLIPLTATGPDEELTLDTPIEGRHKTGGWAALAQSRYQRHIEEHRGQHVAAVAAAVVEWSDRQGAERIVLAGEARMVSLLRAELPERVVTKIAGVVAGARHEAAGVLARRAAEMLAHVDRVEEDVAVDSLLVEAAKGGQAVDGVDRTLDAVNQGKVRHLYVLRGAHDVGRQCESCGALLRGLGGACSYCGHDTRPVELEEAIVDRVIATGGSVTMVDHHEWLSRRGGIAALLRYAA